MREEKENKIMAKFSVTPVKQDEVKVAPSLPKPSVVAQPQEVDGTEGLMVQIFYPFPDDSQFIRNERYGKKTEKADNRDKLISVLTIIGKGTKIPLVMLDESGEELALTDGTGNQLQHTSRLFTLVKGEGVDDDDSEDADDAE